MARRLPPLNALRAFEAAARHLSFTRAAEELNVTQAAISHQVKGLEERLGVVLFRRLNRSLLLTDAGQSYLPEVRDAFDRIAEATWRITAHDSAGVLTVSVLPSFAAKWLVQRLGRFREAHPDIDVHVAPSDDLVDFARENVDLAIRYGQGEWPGLRADRLMTEELFPVCSPNLLQGPHPLSAPADLRHHTLLHDDLRIDWRMWLMAAGVDGVDSRRGPGFTDSSMVIQAAVEGQGVALGRSALAAADLAAGRLVKLFDISLPAAVAYYVVCPEATAGRPKIVAFREWVIAEAVGGPARGNPAGGGD
ncbi:MAG: transcriptional regulator GcvA [Proteobacteria bacterium]|nr:transcriptional regulator GcvA [Pseudomonadota bacterium]